MQPYPRDPLGNTASPNPLRFSGRNYALLEFLLTNPQQKATKLKGRLACNINAF